FEGDFRCQRRRARDAGVAAAAGIGEVALERIEGPHVGTGESADGVARGIGDRNAVAAVPQGGGAGGVGADEVALDGGATQAGATRIVNPLNLGRRKRATEETDLVHLAIEILPIAPAADEEGRRAVSRTA